MNFVSRSFERRRFLKATAAAFGALGLAHMAPFLSRARAGGLASGKKLLFIWLRGGMDSVQACIPFGDRGVPGQALTYSEARPTLAVDPAVAHDLNGFASLHPSFQGEGASDPRVLDIFRGAIDSRGPNLAVLHRIGYENQNRSHFSSQQFWENGVPGSVQLEEGVFNRYIASYLDESKPMQAATVSGNQMVLMKGDVLIPVLRSIDDYSLPSNVLLGTLPSKANPLGSGLKGAYGQTGFDAAIEYNPLTYGTGRTLLESLQFFQENVLSTPYEPDPDARPYYDAIADGGFRSNIRDCARLLKQVGDIQIVGCNQGGYDTHGSEDARLPALLRDLGLAFTALYYDLRGIWDQTVVVTFSEFGRTSQENGNRGTDHGESSLCFAMGGPVAGGVYNCDEATWPDGTLFSTQNGRYVSHRHDFRLFLKRLLTGHLGDPAGHIDSVIPGYSALEAGDPNGYFQGLEFLA